ncbi:MAG: hypothetical protein H3Z53_06715 [archaeon]|nr:hypothetical protein [archaeon]
MIMSEREKVIDDIVRGIVKLMALPFSETFDKVFIETLPKKYAEPAEHFINARIELLSAFKSILDRRIERLNEIRERVKERAEEVAKKEKVQVE